MLVHRFGGAATGRLGCLPLCLLAALLFGSMRRDGFEDQKIVETVRALKEISGFRKEIAGYRNCWNM